MTLKTDKLIDFLNISIPNPVNEHGNYIIKYIQPISKELFDKAYLTINSISTSYLYWDNPGLNESFLAIDECQRNNKLLQIEETNFISNQDEFSLERIPDILLSRKFPNDKSADTWQDFDNSYAFIPKIIFYKKTNDYFLTIFSEYGNNKTYSEIIEEFEKYLDDINNSQNIIINQPSIDIITQTNAEDWEKMINYSLQKIKDAEIKKVVLSRFVSGNINSKTDLNFLTSKLKDDYPGSYIFIYKRNSSIFLGASPEKLFSINGNVIETEALAGTIARGESNSTDNELSDLLLNDSKELSEHNNVLDYIVSNLYEITTDIKYQAPTIKKLKYIQHLWTPITAKLRPGQSIHTLINKLHPTPAVCGDPKEKALHIINELEKFDRGLFTGILGWYNNKGYGDVIVAIRSALIKNNKLLLFAGCGIVEGSTPEKEFTETELKLKSILSLFKNETTNQS